MIVFTSYTEGITRHKKTWGDQAVTITGADNAKQRMTTGGRYELDSCPLYISRGIGTSIVPLRIGARPEIALFKL